VLQRLKDRCFRHLKVSDVRSLGTPATRGSVILKSRRCLPGRRISTFCVFAALTAFFCAAKVNATQTAATPPSAYRQVTDEIGRTIRIPQSIHRIVSLAPNLTETIYALGLQDRLVGDTDYCDFPAEAQQKPKVGGAVNPSLEVIAALHPDLVLVTKSLNRLETVNALAEIGIPSYATDPHTVDAIIVSIAHLADLLGATETGPTLAATLERELAALHDHLAGLSPRRVLFIVWTEPLISIGKDTFIADALHYAGATSVIDSSQSWPQINLEEVVRLQPEFLIFVESHSGAAPHSVEALAELPGWRLLNAVRNRRYATISDAINRPAPRLLSAVEDLARQLHPEAFTEKPQTDGDEDKAKDKEKDKVNPPAPSTLPDRAFTSPAKPTAASQEPACAR
jgi:iron complex transport system substrate-binding protein